MLIKLNIEPTEVSARHRTAAAITPDRLVDDIRNKLSRETKNVLLAGPATGDNEIHASYMYMVRCAYSVHDAVRISPHDLWYIVLCEIAATINSNSDAFRFLFTNSTEKTEITVLANDPTHLPLDAIVANLRDLVPADVDLFIPEFTTHTENSRTACYAAFADAVKSYYSYSTFCCGLPAVEIGGTREDWVLFGKNITQIAALLEPAMAKLAKPVTNQWGEVSGTMAISRKYFDKVSARVSMICDIFDGGDTTFVKSLYRDKNVGSGGQIDVTGWLAEFYVNPTKRIDGFNPCLSIVPYKNIDTGRNFSVVFGSFSSHFENDVRVADYGSFVFEHEALTEPVSQARVYYSDAVGTPLGEWPA